MKKLNYPNPHPGWKIYFFLLAVLTVFGVMGMRGDILEIVNVIAAMISLAGLGGYAWSVLLFGSARFWFAVAWGLVLLVPINLAVTGWKGRSQLGIGPTEIILALLLAGMLIVPNIVAIFCYARRLKRIEI
jgi:hypothetical protein